MNGKEHESGAATRKDIDQVLDFLHNYKHHFVTSVEAISKTQAELEHRITTLETYAKILSGGVGITLAGIAALGFFFGGLRETVSNASTKTDKVYQVVLENSDSLTTRTKAIETKLDALNQKLAETPNPQRRR